MSRLRRALIVIGVVACVGCAARTTAGPSTPPHSPPSSRTSATHVNVTNDDPGTIPVGQKIDARLQSSCSSETVTVEQRFEATTAGDLTQNGRVLVPAGSVVRGIVSGVDKAGRLDRSGALTLSFDRMVVDGRAIPMRGTAADGFDSEGIREAGRELGSVKDV
jgi:type IV pilus biogenesis protein CpaD/CtpE